MRRTLIVILPAVAVALLAAGCRPAIPEPASQLSGTWDTSYSGTSPGRVTLTLTQRGAHVTGTYQGGTQGTVEGQLTGQVLNGRWQEASSEGSFTFTFSDDWRTFHGTFDSGGGAYTGEWNGTRN